MRKNGKKIFATVLFLIMVISSGTFIFADDFSEASESEIETKYITDCVISNIDDVTFDGTCHKPKVVVSDGEITLSAGKDYLVTYGENIQAGKGHVFITGLGTYTGEMEKTFVIKKASVKITGSNVSSTGKPKVSWRKVKGAVKYKVYRATKQNGTYLYMQTTDNRNHVDKNAARGKTYYYQVKPIDQDGKTINFETSNKVNIACKLPWVKMKSSNVSKTGKPKLSWTKVKGAEKYAVYRAPSKNGKYIHMTTTKKTEWINTSAKAGKKYYYKVKAIDLDSRSADSALSKAVLRSCDLSRPVVNVTLTSKAKPKLTWKKVSGAERYEIFRAVKKNGTYTSLGKTAKAAYIDQKAKGGKIYYYRVRAIDADNSGAHSAKSLKDKIYVVDLNKKLVALTFDDGPGPYTIPIVNALKKYNGRATFFVLGQRVKSYSAELKAIHQGGNEIGNHSYSHPILSYEDSSVIKSQMRRTDRAIKEVIGVKPILMRPPGGGIDSTVKKNVGKPLIMWSIDTRDWEHRNTQTTINCVMNEASDGDIVLMHDIHEPTMEAAIQLIPKLKKKGFELVTVSELAKFKGKKLKDGVVYYSF